jgi:hypothetical protein
VKNFAEGDIYVVAHDKAAFTRISKLYRDEIRPANKKALEFLNSRIKKK